MKDMVYPCGSVRPSIDPSVFVAESADLIGDVVLERDASVWYRSVLRGDINRIKIGERTNIQDGCILHVRGDLPCIVGSDVTVGHGAILHACIVESECLIGMGAIVLDGSVIAAHTLVAAGALVLNGAKFPGGMLIGGVPARVLRALTEDEKEMIVTSARDYVGYARKLRGT